MINYGNENVATMSYKIEFSDSARFMETWLPSLVDNLAEGIHKIWWKIVLVLLNIKMLLKIK